MRVVTYLLHIMVLLVAASGAATAATVVTTAAKVPGELLVRFKDTVVPFQQRLERRNVHERHGARAEVASARLGIEHWILPEGADEEAVIQALQARTDVLYAEPNFIRSRRQNIPNDPNFEKQWGMSNTGQEVNGTAGVAGADMSLPQAWQLTTGSRSVKVGLIDDGFELFHPDLESNFDQAGVNIDGGGLPLPGPSGYHGTLIAGVLGAVGNNQTGIAGVAWDVLMLPIRFNLTVAQEVKAIDYALAQNVDFLSLSYGSSDYSKAEQDAFEKLYQAGVLVFVSAGNNWVNNDLVPDYPSSYPFANIISVAASTASDKLVSWSHFGKTKVDLMAPGYSIYTTSGKEGYRFSSGTSFSAPAVAGVAALIKSYHGQADWREIKARLFAGVDVLPQVRSYLAAEGRVNAHRALTIEPKPVLTISRIQIKNAAEGDQLVAGMDALLTISLENHWIDVTKVEASLVSLSPWVTVLKGETKYPDLTAGELGANVEPFEIAVSAEALGHHQLPFELTLSSDQGEPVVRQFLLEFGELRSGQPAMGVIQKTDRDIAHTFWLDVPQGTANLRLKTTSDANIDLIVRHSAKPHYYLESTGLKILDSELQDGTRSNYSIKPSGEEEVVWISPKPGRYWVVVANTSEELERDYCVSALMENPDDSTTQKALNPYLWECGDPPPSPPPSSSGGGGGQTGLGVMALCLMIRFIRSARRRCQRLCREGSVRRVEK